jgi:hypothetical protein
MILISSVPSVSSVVNLDVSLIQLQIEPLLKSESQARPVRETSGGAPFSGKTDTLLPATMMLDVP